MPNPWFRFYSETLRDRKIEHLARVTGQPKTLLLGVWVTLLSLANDSPIPGALLLTEDIPLAVNDLSMELGMDADTTGGIIDALIGLRMLMLEAGVYCITNWEKRQFKSDSSQERVRAYRERKAQSQAGDGNDTVTLHVTPPSVSVSDSVSESSGVVRAVEKPNGQAYTNILARWAALFPNRPHPTENNKALREKATRRLKDDDFLQNWDAALVRMTRADPWVFEKAWFTLNWFLANDENWRKCYDGNYDRKGSPPPSGMAVGLEPEDYVDPDLFFAGGKR